MTKRISLILPESTIAIVDRLTTHGNRSGFIDRAILHYAEAQRIAGLRKHLKAGYRSSAPDDLTIAAEWFPLEQEVIEKYARVAKTSRSPRS